MEIKKTITSIFIVPIFGIDKASLTKHGYVNGYIRDERRDVQYKDCIYLLFKPTDLETFREFLDDEYERTKAIIDDYDYEDGYVIIVYKIDGKHSKDVACIKEGLYSRTSSEFQALFPKIVKIVKNGLHRDEISLQYRVFNKTEDLKQYWEEKLGVDFDDSMEVWSRFDIEKEILNLDKIKENV